MVTLVVAAQDICYSTLYMWWSQFALRFIPRLRQGPDYPAFLQLELPALLLSVIAYILFLGPLISIYLKISYTNSIIYIIQAYMISRSLNMYAAERSRSEGKIFYYTVQQVCVPILGIICLFLISPYCGANANSVLAGLFIAQASGIIFFIITSNFSRIRPRINAVLIRQALRFGGPMMAASLLSVLAVNAPRFVVDMQFGLAVTGVFSVSYGLGLRVSSFASMMVTAGAYPLVVKVFEERGVEAAYGQLRDNITLLAFVVMPASFGLVSINHSICQVFLPGEFVGTAVVILPFAAFCGLLRDMRSHTTGQVFLLHGNTTYSSIIGAFDLFLTVILSIAGALLWGVYGAVIGPFAAAALSLLTSWLVAYYKFRFEFPMENIARICIASAIMAAIVGHFPSTSHLSTLSALILAGGLLYALIVVTLLPSLRYVFLGVLLRMTRKMYEISTRRSK